MTAAFKYKVQIVFTVNTLKEPHKSIYEVF